MSDTIKQQPPKVAVRFPDLPRRPAGIAPNPYLGPHWQEGDTKAEIPAAPASRPDTNAADLAAELSHSLQLSRAGALALTRLNLAIKCGDRHAAMSAMDRLHAVDADMERLVDRLPAPAPRDPQRSEWEAIARHLADQKLTLAFEKLAMMSEISGPGLASKPRGELLAPDFGPSRAHPHDADDTPDTPAALAAAPHDTPPLAEWPPHPTVVTTEWKALPGWVIALAMLLTLAAAAAVVMVITGW